MATNDSSESDSTLPDLLDYVWCLMDNCNLNDHSNCRHPQYLRRTRPHLLAYYSSPTEEANERKPDHYKPQGSQSLSTLIRDRQRVKDLELTLKAITRLRNTGTKTKAMNRVNEWRVEKVNLMNAEKSQEDDRRFAPTGSYRETMQELLKLHNTERDKWKLERDKSKLERESWKLTCKRLKDEASAREEQIRKLNMESQRWKDEFNRLASADAEGKNVAEVCGDLLEQLPGEQQTLHLQRRTGDIQKVSNPQDLTGKLERSSDCVCGHFTHSESDVWQGKCNRPEAEDWISQQQALPFISEKQRWEALSAKLSTAVSAGKKLEGVCRDLFNQLEQRNVELKRNKVELQKVSKWQALAQQRIREQREEIKMLKKTEVAECIICTNEFGEDPDRQRAYWKNCNHANICYKCTKTLWTSKNRQCPTCKTPASSIPTRLPPKIYL